MAPTTSLAVQNEKEIEQQDSHYQRGVKHLCESGITKIPTKYILPILDRPNEGTGDINESKLKLNLPVIDFALLKGPGRHHALKSLAKACEEYGFFQLVNHDIPSNVILKMVDVSRRFFELPFEERSKYMSADMTSPVRYGTSYNQNKDSVFCWRDFLKLNCHPLSDILPLWPTSPADLSQAVVQYAKETRFVYLMLMEAILESLGVADITERETKKDNIEKKEFEDGSQLIVLNCYPSCPEPELTLGMPPHSDYGFLTLLLQDEVKGLQIHHEGKWLTLEPLPNSFTVNVGDHLEIYSNGRYKSVLHRVLANSYRTRISVASLHSVPFGSIVKPCRKLVDDVVNKKRYKDTDFAAFLEYISSCETKNKSFLETRKLNN